MSTKFTITLAIVAALLITAYFILPGGPGNDRRVGDYVTSFQADDIRGIIVERDGEKFEFTRVPDGWLLGPKPADRANAAVVERIVSAAKTLLILDAISPGEFREKYRGQDFGFANPRQRLLLDTERGKVEILFGREGAGENRIFVRTNDSDSTFLVSDELQKILLEQADSFRDPRLVSLPTDRIERFQVERADGTLEFQRQGEQWRIARPLQDWADTAAIDHLLELVLGARVFSFQPIENATSGNTWNSTIKLWPEGEDQPITLRIADIPEAEQIALEHPSRSAVVSVPGENFHILRLPLEALRSRRLLHFNQDLVDRMTVRVGAREENFSRNSEGQWSHTAGDSVGKSTQGDNAAPAIEQLFSLLGSTKVESFLLGDADLAKSEPTVQIILNSWLSENTPEAPAGLHDLWQISFWTTADGRVLARMNGEPGLRQLPNSFLDSLQQWMEERNPAAE